MACWPVPPQAESAGGQRAKLKHKVIRLEGQIIQCFVRLDVQTGQKVRQVAQANNPKAGLMPIAPQVKAACSRGFLEEAVACEATCQTHRQQHTQATTVHKPWAATAYLPKVGQTSGRPRSKVGDAQRFGP